MGFWGTKLYDNDLTCDVRDYYIELLKEKCNDEEAYNKTIKYFDMMINSDEEPFFWYALAETQWKVGRLIEYIKNNALAWIEKEGGLDFWEDNIVYVSKWKHTLMKLKSTLLAPIMKKKTFHVLKQFISNPWSIGDLYAFCFYSEASKDRGIYNKYIILQKIGDEYSYNKIKYSRVQIYNKIYDYIPKKQEIYSEKLLPLIGPFDKSRMLFGEKQFNIENFFNRLLFLDRNSEKIKKYYIYIENDTNFKNLNIKDQDTAPFSCVDEWVGSLYFDWKNYDYIENENGIFQIYKKT